MCYLGYGSTTVLLLQLYILIHALISCVSKWGTRCRIRDDVKTAIVMLYICLCISSCTIHSIKPFKLWIFTSVMESYHTSNQYGRDLSSFLLVQTRHIIMNCDSIQHIIRKGFRLSHMPLCIAMMSGVCMEGIKVYGMNTLKVKWQKHTG